MTMTFRHPIDSYVHRTSILGEHMEMLHLHLDLQHCYANANTVIFCRFYFFLAFFFRSLARSFVCNGFMRTNFVEGHTAW